VGECLSCARPRPSLYTIARNRALTRRERKTWFERVRAELSREAETLSPPVPEALGVGKSAITMRLDRFRTRVKRELSLRLARVHWGEVREA
jgi:DNA-directed RNA polymerase specialized sigma24 family protein